MEKRRKRWRERKKESERERGRKGEEVVPEGQSVPEEGKSGTYKCTKKRADGERHEYSYEKGNGEEREQGEMQPMHFTGACPALDFALRDRVVQE